MPPGNHAPVFEPEVEEIPVDDDARSLRPAVLEPGEKSPLGLGRGDAQMNVTGQVDGWTLHREAR